MSRGGFRGGFGGGRGRGGGGELQKYKSTAVTLCSKLCFIGGRGGGRGGFQQRDMGPPDTVLGMSPHSCHDLSA